MLARNGPVGNSGYAACGFALKHSSLFPRCVLRFSARANGTPVKLNIQATVPAANRWTAFRLSPE